MTSSPSRSKLSTRLLTAISLPGMRLALMIIISPGSGTTRRSCRVAIRLRAASWFSLATCGQNNDFVTRKLQIRPRGFKGARFDVKQLTISGYLNVALHASSEWNDLFDLLLQPHQSHLGHGEYCWQRYRQKLGHHPLTSSIMVFRTSRSLHVSPGRPALVESETSARMPSSPSSRSLGKAETRSSKGVGSNLKVPRVNDFAQVVYRWRMRQFGVSNV